MKEDFLVHNLYWKSFSEFEKLDPHLSRLIDIPFIHKSKLEEEIPIFTPGIYILTGGRQVGKSTLLKLIIKRLLLENKLPPSQMYYLPCDTIEDYRRLLFEIEQFRQSLVPDKYFVLFIDEVCYVEEWDRAIKSLSDAGFFNNGSVVITGSDTFILKEAMMRFPGRRGDAVGQDFHLHPLSFYEYISLKNFSLCSCFNELRTNFQNRLILAPCESDKDSINVLYTYFNEYLLTGGFMPAINDFAKNNNIRIATYRTYVQWIVGDMLKRHKQELYLKELFTALIPRLAKQITWHNLSYSTSIEHHQTVADYVNLLCRMDVVTILNALREDKLQSAPKKAKKLCFNDPFIFHSLYSWIRDEQDAFKLAYGVVNSTSDLRNSIIEGVIASLLSRVWKTYYIKAEGEVDVVLIHRNRFFPIEIKNSITPDRKELRQILKYRNGFIAYAGYQIAEYQDLHMVPIPLLALIAC